MTLQSPERRGRERPKRSYDHEGRRPGLRWYHSCQATRPALLDSSGWTPFSMWYSIPRSRKRGTPPPPSRANHGVDRTRWLLWCKIVSQGCISERKEIKATMGYGTLFISYSGYGKNRGISPCNRYSTSLQCPQPDKSSAASSSPGATVSHASLNLWPSTLLNLHKATDLTILAILRRSAR